MKKLTMRHNVSLTLGTASGTVLSMLPNVTSADIARTAILAVVGAVVSFLITLLLKTVFKPKEKSGF